MLNEREALRRVRTMLFDEHAPLLDIAAFIDGALTPPTPPGDEARAREVLQATFGPYDFLELESGSYVSVDTAIAAMLAFAHPAQAGEDAR